MHGLSKDNKIPRFSVLVNEQDSDGLSARNDELRNSNMNHVGDSEIEKSQFKSCFPSQSALDSNKGQDDVIGHSP